MSHIHGGTISPNPDFPQLVKSVTGANTIDIVGKNLFDKNHANIIDNCVTGSGQTLDNVAGCKTLYIRCKPNTTYTISKIASTRFIVCTTDTTPAIGVSTSVRSIDLTGTHITITTGASAKYLCVFYYYSSTDTLTEQQILDSIMIEQDSTATTYEAYKSQSFDLNLGKNLLENKNKNLVSNGITFTLNNDGSILVNGTATGNATYYFGVNNGSYLQKIDKTKTYSLSIGENTFPFQAFLRISDSNNSNLFKQCQNAYGTNSNKVENIAGSFFESGIIIAQLFIYSGAVCNNFRVYPQLEIGATASDYAPYLLPIELNKIGDYQDYLYNTGGKWYKHKAIGKTIISVASVKTNYTALDYAVINRETNDIDYNTYGTHKCYCNLGISTNKDNDTPYDNTFYLWKLEGKAALTSWWFGITKNTTLADAQTMLNGGYIYYILATPIEEEITDLVTLNYLNNLKYGAESYYGTTNITITSSELQPTMKVQTLDKIV